MRLTFSQNTLIKWLWLTLFLLSLITLSSYIYLVKVHENYLLVQHTNQALDALDDVVLTLREAETGQRGFLLTGQERYLEPYHSAEPRLDRSLDKLRRLIGEHSVQQGSVDQ